MFPFIYFSHFHTGKLNHHHPPSISALDLLNHQQFAVKYVKLPTLENQPFAGLVFFYDPMYEPYIWDL